MIRDTNKVAVVRPKRSGVRDYFAVNVTDDSKVSCLLCPAIITRGGKEMKNYNTTNMRCHLETQREDEFTTLTAKEKELERERQDYFVLFIKVLHWKCLMVIISVGEMFS